MFFERKLSHNLQISIQDSPVLLVRGARQVGKSTLIKHLFQATHQYLTFDDPNILASCHHDPLAFLESLTQNVILDEIQRVPHLLPVLKKVVDDFPRPGHFILTGSADILHMKNVSESLVGRMEVYDLWSLTQSEIENTNHDFIERAFSSESVHISSHRFETASDIGERMSRGGYPEAIRRINAERRAQWFKSYLTTLIQKDIRDLANIEGLVDFPKLISLIAARCGSLFNNSELSRCSGIPQTTLKRYLTLLEHLYLTVPLLPWSENRSKRLVKSPKIYMSDTGLLMHVLGNPHSTSSQHMQTLGHVFENFVVMEIIKQLSWNNSGIRAYHYRTHTGQEVDIILERPDGQLVGIEIKLSQQIQSKDFLGLKTFKEDIGARFQKGIVLYTGTQKLVFGGQLESWPIHCLWT